MFDVLLFLSETCKFTGLRLLSVLRWSAVDLLVVVASIGGGVLSLALF